VKIEVLYVCDCPNHPAAVALVRDVLRAQGVEADIREVLVANETMAKELEFRGSPTVRVNGRDVVAEPNGAKTVALCCRFYSGSSQICLPPIEAVRRAIVEASEEERPKQGTGIVGE